VTGGKEIKKQEVEVELLAIETILDSVSQKLLRRGDPLARKVRRLQRRYFPNRVHSLRRYVDSQIGPGGKIIRPPHKRNWRKWRRERMRAAAPKLDRWLKAGK